MSSPYRWMLSALIVFHITAVLMGLLPQPSELKAVTEVRHPVETDRVALVLTPIFDRLALFVERSERILYDATRSIRMATRFYARTGLKQRWQMFANPSTDDRYIRLRYYVDSGEIFLNVSTELVLPVADTESRRYVRGKAIRNALNSYQDKDYRTPSLDSPESIVFPDLVPVTRYYRDRFVRARLKNPQRVVRTEFWLGRAPIPPPGYQLDANTISKRERMLDAYKSLPQTTASRYTLPARGASEREADIVWNLQFVDVTD